MYELIGTIKVIKDTEQINDRFSKREFVVSDNHDKYPQVIQFELTQDKCTLLDEFTVGNDVKVTFNVRGREWKSPQGDTRYFVSLNAWKLEKTGTGMAPGGGAPAAAGAVPAGTEMVIDCNDDEEIDDIPF
jgi:hypothetical protein